MEHPEYNPNYLGSKSIGARFWANVQKSDGCWIWTGGRSRAGYGRFSYRPAKYRGVTVYAHRLSYEWAYGYIPENTLVLHSCDNPSCVRPEHLHLGNHADNSREMVQRGRSASGDRNASRRNLDRRPRGDEHTGARLNTDQVLKIRAQHAAGMSERGLARIFGVGRSTIRRIVQRLSWKHL